MDSPNRDNSQEKVPAEEKDSTKVPILLRDFVADMLTSFPEIRESIESYVIHSLSGDSIENEDMSTFVNYVKEVYPPRFFDILYKNEEIFSPGSEVNVHFLPGINFKDIWNITDITETLKDTIWKYLQVIMLSVINDVSSHDSFGDTAKLFEAINEDDLKTKLQETMNTLQEAMGENGLFSEDKEGAGRGENNEEAQEGSSSSSRASSSNGMPDLPLPEEIHDHINGLLQGNLGRLATEIAEETAEEFDFDMEGVDSVNDVFQKMFRDPGKIMGLVKNIGSKLDSKIKEKDMSQADLMKEATDMMSKMKDMPGMGNISSMFKNMGMDVNDMASMASMASSMGNIPGLKAALGGGKLNLGAMQASLERNMESAKKIEQMKKRIEYKKADALKQQAYKEEKQREREANHIELNEEELEELIFSIEGSEQANKTSRFPDKTSKQQNANGGKKKKKKGKK